MESNSRKAADKLGDYLADCECGVVGSGRRKEVPAVECKTVVSERLGVGISSINWTVACRLAKVGIRRRNNQYWWFFKEEIHR